MDDMKEFVAFSRKLLRVLRKIKEALDKGEIDKVREMIDELIEDTERDIEA